MPFLDFAERALRRALNAGGLESRWVQTSIARHHLYDAPGRGHLPTVVFLHGISASGTAFAPVIQRLRPHVRRVLAPDAPGHGFSSDPVRPLTPETLRAAMHELLDRELDEPAIVCGNSLGGGVAIDYALERPERGCGLFLTSPAGARMTDVELERFLHTFRLGSRAAARDFLHRLYHRAPWFAPLLAGDVQRRFTRATIRNFTAAVTVDHLFTAEQLGGLSVPVHLVWGRSERLMPSSHLAFFKQSLPKAATFDEPEGFGHCGHLDNPRLFADMIVDFARRVSPS
jgi:pimeloyl-ACP methyl ester carboxylesterase